MKTPDGTVEKIIADAVGVSVGVSESEAILDMNIGGRKEAEMKASSIVRRVMHNVSGKGIVSRVDIDRVDVIPHGSRTALKKVKLSGDASAVTIGDEVSLINVQGEIMAVSSLTFEDIPASESTEVTEYAPKDHTHENIDAGMLDGKHSDRFVQINEEDGITVVPGDMRMNGVLGSTFDRFMGELGSWRQPEQLHHDRPVASIPERPGRVRDQLPDAAGRCPGRLLRYGWLCLPDLPDLQRWGTVLPLLLQHSLVRLAAVVA